MGEDPLALSSLLIAEISTNLLSRVGWMLTQTNGFRQQKRLRLYDQCLQDIRRTYTYMMMFTFGTRLWQ
jgi:hypothetical protein